MIFVVFLSEGQVAERPTAKDFSPSSNAANERAFDGIRRNKIKENAIKIRGKIIGLLCAMLLAVSGCGKIKPPMQAKDREQKTDPRLRVPGKIDGMGWHIPWYERDPKHPNGPAIPVLIADAKTGEVVNQKGNPAIVMKQVRAKLFREGRHVADIEAAQITANQRDKILHGRGGCKVISHADSAETVLTADTIKWNTESNRMVATGHARVTRRPLRSSPSNPPVSQEGGTIIYDLAKGEVVVQ